MNKKRRKSKFEKLSKVVFGVVFVLTLFGTLIFNSYESSINIDIQRVQEDIDEAKATLDGLNTARQEKISFDNIVDVAKKNGYSLNFASSQVAAKNE